MTALCPICDRHVCPEDIEEGADETPCDCADTYGAVMPEPWELNEIREWDLIFRGGAA